MGEVGDRPSDVSPEFFLQFVAIDFSFRFGHCFAQGVVAARGNRRDLQPHGRGRFFRHGRG